MLAGISLAECIGWFGTAGATTTKQVIKALHDLGIPCGEALVRIKQQPKPSVCMVVLHFAGVKCAHWVVYNNGKYYDPAEGIGDGYIDTVRETSYLPIAGAEGGAD